MAYVSSTGWESSFFGGGGKMIYDHPEIYTPFDIDWKFDSKESSKCELTTYTKDKLVKMFLLKVGQNDMYNTLLLKGEVKQETTFGMFVRDYYYISRESVQHVCQLLQNDPDIGSLFKTYLSLLSTTDIKIKLPKKDDKDNKKEEDDKKGGKPPEGESGKPKKGDGKDDEQDSNSKHPTNEQLEEVLKNFSEIKAKPSFYSNWSKGESVSNGNLAKNTQFKRMQERKVPIRFNKQVISQATQLQRLLDISFDPKEDVIPNLMTGKLDSAKIGEIPAGNSHVYFRKEEHQSTKPFSICILADESGSMTTESNDIYQNHLLKVLYKTFSEIVSKDCLYIYGHSGGATPEIRVYHDKYNHTFETTIESQMLNHFQQNYDGPVIEAIHKKVREQTSDNIIFISISDGEPAGYQYGGTSAIMEMKRIIEKAKRDNFVTVGIGLKYDRVKDIYQYHTVITDNKFLVQNVSWLLNRVVKTEFQD